MSQLEVLKKRFNNRFIHEEDKCVGQIVGIELDYDTVCFAIVKEEDKIEKKYVLLKDINSICVSIQKDKIVKSFSEFIKDEFSKNAKLVEPTTDKLRTFRLVDEALHIFIIEEFQHNKYENSPFSIWYKVNNVKALFTRINKSEVLIRYLMLHNGEERSFIKKKERK